MTSKREVIHDGRGANKLVRVVRQRRTSRFVVSIVVTSCLAVGIVPAAGARGASTCQVKNLTQGTVGRPNLQAAINAAYPGDTISVKGVCVGSFTIDKDLTLVGHQTPDGARPTLDGRGSSGRVVDVTARVTLTNLRITGGTNSPWNDPGGGISVGEGSTLRLNRSVVRGNKAEGGGGGIDNFGRLVLNGSSVIRNKSGGVVNRGSMVMNGSSSVRGNTEGGIANVGRLFLNDRSTVRRNSGAFGGGIYVDGTLRMNDSSSVRGNQSNAGGGIFIDHGIVTMNDASSVSGNSVGEREEGGGIHMRGSSDPGILVMRHSSSVSGNSADSGGGIFTERGIIILLRHSSSVSGNVASFGAGVRLENSSLTMSESSSVSGNTAGILGGGIYVSNGTASPAGSVTLKDASQVYDNAAVTGGGIYVDDGTVSACDGTSVDEWIGTVEPNDPNDFLDSDVSSMSGGTGGCS